MSACARARALISPQPVAIKVISDLARVHEERERKKRLRDFPLSSEIPLTHVMNKILSSRCAALASPSSVRQAKKPVISRRVGNKTKHEIAERNC